MNEIIISKEIYDDYLERLNQTESYREYLRDIAKEDNITNLKNYFNTSIFISIHDFHKKKYKLHDTRKDLKYYLNKNPEKRSHKKLVKKEKVYRIFLREGV